MKTLNTTQKPTRPGTALIASAVLLARALLVAGTLIFPSCNKAPPPTTPANGGTPPGDNSASPDLHAGKVTLTSESIARYGLTVEAAQKHILQPTIIAPARVGFNTEAMAHIGSPLRGRVVEIKVRVGQNVKKGDELCIIESPELGEAQTELMMKRVAKESAGPAVDLAKSSWDRAKNLYEQSQGTSLTEVQRREAEYKAAVAAQRGADAAVTAAENHLHLLGMNQAAFDAFLKTGEVAPRYAIHAPIDGQVIEREITLGELVGPDRELLMVLADLTNVWVLADVPEMHLHELAVGSKAWVRVGPSDAAAIEGQVAYISPKVDMNTRTAQMRIEVATKDLPIKPGMFAQVEIVMSSGGSDSAPVVAIPEVAVQTIDGAAVVFVPVNGEPNTFTKRVVTIGKPVGGMVQVLSGLAVDEAFVAAGSFILKADAVKNAGAQAE
jgi:cobalt-zinc-cadmium efflux system membrane fusion protein